MAQVDQVLYYFTEEQIHVAINEVLSSFLLTQSSKVLLVQAMKDAIFNSLSLEEVASKYNVPYFTVYRVWKELEKQLQTSIAFTIEQRKNTLHNAVSEDFLSKIKNAIDSTLVNCTYNSERKKRLYNAIHSVLIRKSNVTNAARIENLPLSTVARYCRRSFDLMESYMKSEAVVQQHASLSIPSPNFFITPFSNECNYLNVEDDSLKSTETQLGAEHSSKSTELRIDAKYVAEKSVTNLVNENIHEISDPKKAEKILNERLNSLYAAKEMVALYKELLEKEEAGGHNLKSIKENFESFTEFLQHQSEMLRCRFL